MASDNTLNGKKTMQSHNHNNVCDYGEKPDDLIYILPMNILLERTLRRAKSQDCITHDEKEGEKYYYQGRVYQNGLGTKPDLHIAVSNYEKAASHGSIDALCTLGEIFCQNNELGKNETRALGYYKKAADLGCLEALYRVGRAYFLGIGVSKNVKKGEEFLLQAARAGLIEAQFELGNLYKNELFDYEKALQWFQLAYENGDYDAAFHLGLMYEDGLGVKQDWNKAKEMYNRAFTNLHHPFAPYRIGQLYEKGEDNFPQDITKAIEWYKEAGQNGLDQGYLRIGEIYENGIGIDKNCEMAEEYYKRLCDSGNEEACVRLKRIRNLGCPD